MSDTPQDPSSKLHIDSDWKAQAQAEKQKLAEQSQADDEQRGGPGQLPPADFKTLVSSLVTQALFYMGAMPDPSTGQRMIHLDLARHNIDLLAVLEDKTTGNLDDEEQQMMTQTLNELRASFVELNRQVAAHQAKQAAAQQGGAGGSTPPKSGGAGGGSGGGIITPG